MNPISKKSPGAISQPLQRQAGAVRQFKPVVAQLKTRASAPSNKRPTAPAVYRPQPIPRVLQTKTSPAAGRTPAAAPRQPIAPAVYRPEVKKIVQPKANSFTPPPRYRPEQRVAQNRFPNTIQRAAAKVGEWVDDVRAIASAHTQVGPEAGMPQAYDVIEKGPFRGPKTPSEVERRAHVDPVSAAFGMTREEETALYKYSQGMKDVEGSPGYMERKDWHALEAAVDKIPSMGRLGTVATVFRADRSPSFTNFLRSRIGHPCYIVHGAAQTGAGIHHLASAAFTVNNHAIKAPALVRIICHSARYVQYWGMHGASLDGGEVLIPAFTVTFYDGDSPRTERFGPDMGDEERGGPMRLIAVSAMKPVFSLVEVLPADIKEGLPFFDDFRGDIVAPDVLNRILPRRARAVHPVKPGKPKAD